MRWVALWGKKDQGCPKSNYGFHRFLPVVEDIVEADILEDNPAEGDNVDIVAAVGIGDNRLDLVVVVGDILEAGDSIPPAEDNVEAGIGDSRLDLVVVVVVVVVVFGEEAVGEVLALEPLFRRPPATQHLVARAARQVPHLHPLHHRHLRNFLRLSSIRPFSCRKDS